MLEQHEVVLLHDLPAEHHGEELVIGDLLLERADDELGLLEEGLVAPVRVHALKLAGDAVVLAGEERVQHGQDSLLVDAGVAGGEAVDILAGPGMNKNTILILKIFPQLNIL